MKSTRLRPAEGGRFAAPVGPATSTPAFTMSDAQGIAKENEARAMALCLRNVPAPDWGEVAIDARARIRPRSDGANVTGSPIIHINYGVDEELLRERARLVGKRVRWNREYIYTCHVEPIPEEPARPREMTWGELPVGAHFVWADEPEFHGNRGEWRCKRSASSFSYADGSITSRWFDDSQRVTLVDGDG